ncbi:permease-like cell division protein FtsX [Nocardioides sp.]|uniref:permease-like cell division protein FtsX n=1 Tax=Nocardioides sp. TaxID=35761 RepID=UPI002635E5BE|nr:permease-like cell division protein FtsX [Nocardioides sp.]
MQLRYVFTELGQGLRRNLSMHIAVVLTLFVSLTLVGFGAMLNQQATKASDQWGNALQVTVYLCRDKDSNPACTSPATDAQKSAIEKVLTDNSNVSSYYLESKDTAFKKIKELYGADRFTGPNAVATVDMMAESYWVTLKDPHQADLVKEAVVGLDGVSHVQDLRGVVGPILNTIDAMKYAALAIAAFLVIAALLLVANTIRLAAYARRREIAIMRLVGASTLYIALPFLLEALVTAVIGVALTAGAMWAFMEFAVRQTLAPKLDFILWVGWHEFGIALAVVAILGPLLTLLPTLFLTRKYLRV